MGRFSRSWALAKESYAVLKGNPQLSLFPIISGVVTLLVTASFAVPLFFALGPDLNRHIQPNPAYYAVLFLYYFVSYFVVIFFNSALVACAHENLSGRPATYKDGIAVATKHLGAILAWSLISASVGTILRAVSERMGLIGRIVIAILGAAWSLITYFVVPIMIIENQSPVASVKRSTSLLKASWGERVIGGISLGIAVFVFSLIGFVPFIGGIFCLASDLIIPGIGLLITAVLYWLFLGIVASTLTTIFNTALYMYASHQTVPVGFSEEHLRTAFVQKQQSRFMKRG